jgi:hypothetical protein
MSVFAPNNLPGHFIETGVYHTRRHVYSEYDGTDFGTTQTNDVRVTAEYSKSGTVKHNFRDVQGHPWRDPTNYTRKVAQYRYKPGFLKRPFPDNPEWVREEFEGLIFNANPRDFNPECIQENLGILPTDGNAQCITECLLKLNQGKVSLGQYLAESKQSAQMVANAGTDLLNLLLKVKHGQWGSIPSEFGKGVRKGRDYYLQWQYGWKPLCSDIYNLTQDLVHKAPRKPWLSAERQVVTPFDFETKFNGDKVKVKVKHRDRCKLWSCMSSELMSGLSSYDLINPASLTWELVPYSFVVDWFIPVGNTLAALTATAGLEFIGGFVSQTREGSYTITGTVGEVEVEFKYFIRSALNNFPKPGYYGKQNPLSLDRVEKLLALLSQLF